MTDDVEALPESRIPLARPDITDFEIDAVTRVLRTDILSLGPEVAKFERQLANIADRRFGLACSSGTAGLHLAVRALGIGRGDQVITTPFSFVASANCVVYEGAAPHFVDIEEDTLGIDPELAEAAATTGTRAVLAVDVFGNPCRLEEIERLCTERRWRLIEDSCEALGSRLNGRPLGSFGDAAVFAFYPNKQITTGEGGAVLVDDPELARSIRSMRNQGRDDDGTWLRHIQLGFNYRLDELSAALGVVQLGRLAELRAARAGVAAAYAERLADAGWLTLPRAAPGAEVDWFVFVVRLDPRIDRDALIPALEERGVPTRPYFSPLHLQPFYRDQMGYRAGDFPVTERVASSTLALPYSSRMSIHEIDRVVDALADCVGRQLRSAP